MFSSSSWSLDAYCEMVEICPGKESGVGVKALRREIGTQGDGLECTARAAATVTETSEH